MQKYIIDDDDGQSIFIYIPNFFNYSTYSKIRKYLDNTNDWKEGFSYNNTKIKRKQKWFHINNEYFCKKWKSRQPRWESHDYNILLLNIQKIVEDKVKEIIPEGKNIKIPNYNSILINYYENGNQIIPPHKDSKESFGFCPTVSLVSIGTNRKLLVERTLKNILKRDKTKKYMNKMFNLEDNSLFIMAGNSQKYWCHSILKDDTQNSRYSLSIREYL